MTTSPPISPIVQAVCWLPERATTCDSMSASQPLAAALEPGDDQGRVLDRGVQVLQRRGVPGRRRQLVVDQRGRLPDRPGQQQDRRDQGHHHQHDDDADPVADPPSGHVFDTASQKSRTGFRLALTEATTAGTPLVCSATTVTPPRTCPSVARVARRWKMIRIRPTAVIPTISTATTMVNQATAGMGVPLSVPFSAEQFAERAGV